MFSGDALNPRRPLEDRPCAEIRLSKGQNEEAVASCGLGAFCAIELQGKHGLYQNDEPSVESWRAASS